VVWCLSSVHACVLGPGTRASGAEPPNPEGSNSGARQLLGIRGASSTDNKWAIRLQLMKPVTWVPLIWGVLCGAAASGEFTWTAENVGKALLCMSMSGPLLTGYTQASGQLSGSRLCAHAACPGAGDQRLLRPRD